MLTLEVFFWVIAFIIIYIYFGYPVLCWLCAKIIRKPVIKDDNYLPKVTLIIAAYNEEKFIEKKLQNTLDLDYTKDKLEVIVVSDGSADRTNSIVRRFESAGIQLLEFKENRGKTACQNDAVKQSTGHILVFSDANAIYKQDALQRLVRNFKDPKVGCVCGELRYLQGNGADGHGEGLYWRYEQFLKKMESRIGNVLGANGSIYAVRKELYVPLDKDIISDFVEPLKIAARGYRVVYEPQAVSYEYLSSSYSSELNRKVRIINRSYRGILSIKYLLNPFSYGLLAVGLVSHKLLRWFAWAFLLLLFVLNIILAFESNLYLLFLTAQVVFYLMALVGMFYKKLWKPLQIPTYFCMVNYASYKGLLMHHMGNRIISWQPSRD